MRTRRMVRGFVAFGTLALVGAFTASALAQPATVPVRVGQSSDGTLYVVQGGNTWTLVPDQLSDSDVAAMTPTGEIDGTFPNELFVVQAPAAPPVAAPPPPAAAPAPAAPAPPAATAPITGTADLTGKAGNDIPGATAVAVSAMITSVVDRNTKPRDVYAIALSGGAAYTLFTSSKNQYGNAGVIVDILNPNGSPAKQMVPGGYYVPGCFGDCTFAPAVSGTYYLQMSAQTTGQNYTFTLKQT